MSVYDKGSLATYSSLTDSHLAGYFSNNRIRRYLLRKGLINKYGEPVSETEYRLNMARKDHEKSVRDLIAQAIMHKALNLEHERQVEIGRSISEISKLQLVKRVRTSDRRAKSHKRILSSRQNLSKTLPNQEIDTRFLTKMDTLTLEEYNRVLACQDVNSSEKTPYLRAETDDDVGDSSTYRQQNRRPETAKRRQRTYSDSFLEDSSSERSKHESHASQIKEDEKNKEQRGKKKTNKNNERKQSQDSTGYSIKRAGIYNDENDIPISTVRGGLRQKMQTNALVRMKFWGPPSGQNKQPRSTGKTSNSNASLQRGLSANIPADHFAGATALDPTFEVCVEQQHCGGNTRRLFCERILPGIQFEFMSRRHHSFPFSLTIYVNGVKNIRVSTCCEHKHRFGKRLGFFSFVKITGSSPCYRCEVEESARKSKDKPLKNTTEEEALKEEDEEKYESNDFEDDEADTQQEQDNDEEFTHDQRDDDSEDQLEDQKSEKSSVAKSDDSDKSDDENSESLVKEKSLKDLERTKDSSSEDEHDESVKSNSSSHTSKSSTLIVNNQTNLKADTTKDNTKKESKIYLLKLKSKSLSGKFENLKIWCNFLDTINDNVISELALLGHLEMGNFQQIKSLTYKIKLEENLPDQFIFKLWLEKTKNTLEDSFPLWELDYIIIEDLSSGKSVKGNLNGQKIDGKHRCLEIKLKNDQKIDNDDDKETSTSQSTVSYPPELYPNGIPMSPKRKSSDSSNISNASINEEIQKKQASPLQKTPSPEIANQHDETKRELNESDNDESEQSKKSSSSLSSSDKINKTDSIAKFSKPENQDNKSSSTISASQKDQNDGNVTGDEFDEIDHDKINELDTADVKNEEKNKIDEDLLNSSSSSNKSETPPQLILEAAKSNKEEIEEKSISDSSTSTIGKVEEKYQKKQKEKSSSESDEESSKSEIKTGNNEQNQIDQKISIDEEPEKLHIFDSENSEQEEIKIDTKWRDEQLKKQENDEKSNDSSALSDSKSETTTEKSEIKKIDENVNLSDTKDLETEQKVIEKKESESEESSSSSDTTKSFDQEKSNEENENKELSINDEHVSEYFIINDSSLTLSAQKPEEWTKDLVDVMVKRMESTPNLTRVDFSGMSALSQQPVIFNEILKCLRSKEKLSYFGMSDCNLSSLQITLIATQLSNWKQLEHLDLSGNSLPFDSISALTKKLLERYSPLNRKRERSKRSKKSSDEKENSNDESDSANSSSENSESLSTEPENAEIVPLKCLKLDFCQIDMEGWQNIGNLLVANIPIETLSLSGNSLTGNDCEIFAENLKQNFTIKKLILSQCEINLDDMAMFFLKSDLQNKTNMELLDLTNNNVPSEMLNDGFLLDIISNIKTMSIQL